MNILQRALFYILIFMLPWQRRLILYRFTVPNNEWASAYLYATDIVAILLLVLFLTELISRWQLWRMSKWHWSLLMFVLVSVVSVFNARLPWLSIYGISRLVIYLGLCVYLAVKYVGNGVSVNKIFSLDFLRQPISLTTLTPVIIGSALLQASIAVLQYILQTAAGFRWLGESPLTPGAYGVASFYFNNQPILRAYGTTPHPNILAVFLMTALFASWFYIFNLKNKIHYYLSLAVYLFLIWALILTYSRTVIAVWLLAAICVFVIVYIKYKNNVFQILRIKQIIACTLGFLVIYSVVQWPILKTRFTVHEKDEAVTERLFFVSAATRIASDQLLLGVGYGNFVPKLMAQYIYRPSAIFQPVHNMYLLILSEVGLIGLVAFGGVVSVVLYRGFRQRNWIPLSLFGALLLVGVFDHLLWTSQQGNLIFWLSAGLIMGATGTANIFTSRTFKKGPDVLLSNQA